MKKILLILTMFLFVAIVFSKEPDLLQLLRSKKWVDRDKAISRIKKDLNVLKNDTTLINEVITLLKSENEGLRNLSNKNQILKNNLHGQENYGYGEYHLDLVQLVLMLDGFQTFNVLLDDIKNSRKISKKLALEMSKEDSVNIKKINLIKSNFTNKEQFYKDTRSEYLYLLSEYLSYNTVLGKEKEIIIKEIILDALNNTPNIKKNSYLLKNARNCAEFFKNDPEIIQALEKSKKLSE